jgi:hypothetical protein
MSPKVNDMPMTFANKSITDFQMQLLLTASKKAAEKKKALGEDGQNPGAK